MVDLSSLGAVNHPQAQHNDLTENTAGEGTYLMNGPTGKTSIPYSNVEAAKGKGYSLTGGDDYRYMHDYIADPKAQLARKTHYEGMLSPTNEILSGVGAEGMKTVGGVLTLLAGRNTQRAVDDVRNLVRKTGVPLPSEQSYSQTEDPVRQHVQSAADWLNERDQVEPNFWAHLGGFGENIAELLTPEALGSLAKGTEVAKAGEAAATASKAAKLADAGKVAQVLEKYPRMRALIGLGLTTAARGATEAGVQTYVKTGGDPDATRTAAEYGAASGAVPLVAGGGRALARNIAEKYARPVLTNDAVEEAARAAAEGRIGTTNATRTPPSNALPASTGEYQFRIPGTPPKFETTGGELLQPAAKRAQAAFKEPQFVTGGANTPTVPGIEGTTGADVATSTPPQARSETLGGGGELQTGDVNVAAAHMQTLQKALDNPELAPEQRAQLQQMRDDMQKQIVGYYQHQRATGNFVTPNFRQVNTREVLDNIASPREAAEHLRNIGLEVYDQANKASGGQWQVLKDYTKAAQDELAGTADVEGNAAKRAELRARVQQGQDGLARILDDPRNGIDRTDANEAVKNLRASFVLDDLQEAIKPLYSIEAQSGFTTGEYRGVNGNRLLQRFDAFLRDNKDARDLIGNDRVDTLRDVFKANDTIAARKRFGGAVLRVATDLLGYRMHGVGGAAVGEVSYQGIRRVLDGMVRNPNIARNLLYAIDYGASPQRYGPMAAEMVQKSEAAGAGWVARQQADQQKETDNAGQPQ